MAALIRPRLVLPSVYAIEGKSPLPHVAQWLCTWGTAEVSPSGALVIVPIVVAEDDLHTVLDLMTDVSEDWLRRHPGAPRLRDVATYEREPKGENDYLSLPVALGQYRDEYDPYVDCEDASIGDAAEARVYEGLKTARPKSTWVSPRMRHIVTDLGNGKERDMSKILMAQGRKPQHAINR